MAGSDVLVDVTGVCPHLALRLYFVARGRAAQALLKALRQLSVLGRQHAALATPDCLADERAPARRNKLEPVVTLHHFVHPLWFDALGGFTTDAGIPHFVSFAAFSVRWAAAATDPNPLHACPALAAPRVHVAVRAWLLGRRP